MPACMAVVRRRGAGGLFVDEVGEGVACNEAEEAADEGGGYVGAGGEVVAAAEDHGVFKGKGGQGGIAAAESGGECQAQVG